MGSGIGWEKTEDEMEDMCDRKLNESSASADTVPPKPQLGQGEDEVEESNK